MSSRDLWCFGNIMHCCLGMCHYPFYLCLDRFLFSHLLHHAKPCIYLWSTRERHKASSVESSQAQQCGAIDTLLAVDVAHILFDEKLGLDIGIIF